MGMNSFLLVLGIIAWITVALWPAFIARKKGYSFILFWIISWFISFLLGLLLVLILRDKNETPQTRAADKAAEDALDKEEKAFHK